MRRWVWIASALGGVAVVAVVAGLGAPTPTLNGFDLSTPSIPLEQIESGGPPRDGIPALTDPAMLPAASAEFLRDDDRVLGIALNGEARAYPIKILNWHEVVNDRVGGVSVVVTYCPLCGTGMVFDAGLDGRRALFGVSGLLYQSDVLLYDRETESLWSQLRKEAVTGARMGTRLTLLPALHTTWAAWRAEHPKTLVLSTNTGHSRDYEADPYRGYASTLRLFFEVSKRDASLPPKEWVLGVERGGQARGLSVLGARTRARAGARPLGRPTDHDPFRSSQPQRPSCGFQRRCDSIGRRVLVRLVCLSSAHHDLPAGPQVSARPRSASPRLPCLFTRGASGRELSPTRCV